MAAPLVAPRAPRGNSPNWPPLRQTPERVALVERVLAALDVAPGETAHRDAAGKPRMSEIIDAALRALAERAERRAAR